MLSFWKRNRKRPSDSGDASLDAAGPRLAVLGCGDAFGSAGRLQTSFHVSLSGTRFLIDCGATALIGMERQGLDPNAVDAIVLSHLHGDHYAGLIWWVMHAKHVSGRTTPLTVIGPEGTYERYRDTAELLYPGSTSITPTFELNFETLTDGEMFDAGAFQITPFAVSHPSGSLSAALRLNAEGKVLAYSGDTEWVENLIACAAGADLYISECFGYSGTAYYHMTWELLRQQLPRLDAKRILLTHMGAQMIANVDKIDDPRIVIAEDGLAIDI